MGFADPLSEQSLAEVSRIARQNTQIYEDLYGVFPSNRLRKWSDLLGCSTGTASGNARAPAAASEAAALSMVQGHIVEFPLDFLAEEDLAPSTLSVGGCSP